GGGNHGATVRVERRRVKAAPRFVGGGPSVWGGHPSEHGLPGDPQNLRHPVLADDHATVVAPVVDDLDCNSAIILTFIRAGVHDPRPHLHLVSPNLRGGSVAALA